YEDTQLYGAIRNSESYKEYYAIALGEVPPKTKASVHKKKADSETTPKEKPPTDPKDKRVKQTSKMTGSRNQKQPATGLETLSENAKDSYQEKSNSDTQLTSKWLSDGDDDDEDDDANKDSDAHDDDDEDDDANKDSDAHDDDDDDDDDDDATKSDDDGDNITHPKLSTFSTDDQDEQDGEEEQEEDEEDEEEISDQLVRTPSDYQTSDESEKQKDDDRVKYGEEDKEGDVANVNLEGGDVDMTKADTTKDTEDAHVTLTTATPVMKEAVDVAIQLKSNKLREEAQAENQEFLNSLDSNMQKLIKDQVQNKDLLSSYGDVLIIPRIKDDKDKDEEPSAGSNRGTKRRRSGKEVESSKEPTRKESRTTSSSKGASRSQPTNLNETTHLEFITGDDDVIPAREVQDERQWHPPTSTTPNREWHLTKTIDHLTQELLTGPTYDLIKGTCKSVAELEYHLEEVFKATNEQLEWNNPEGTPYPHNLSKPLPLIPNARGCLVIHFDHFINNDLEYLKGGSLSRKYTTSITKTQTADYGQVKWIEDRIPRTTWSVVPIDYDKHAYWGTYHWGPKRQRFCKTHMKIP
ncbi:hypothetical protein Tco_0612765, partial [Tanacetum coccineum]